MLFQIISIINAVLLIGGVWRLMVLLKLYSIPVKFHWFCYWKVVATILFAIGQVYTVYITNGLRWPWKIGITIYAIMIFVFCRAMESISKKKERR